MSNSGRSPNIIFFRQNDILMEIGHQLCIYLLWPTQKEIKTAEIKK